MAILTENYRKPFKDLLQETSTELNKNVIKALDATLGNYPHFKDLVQDILLNEVEVNKSKAEEYLDVQVDIHKRFINSEHQEFGKLNQHLKKDGIRYKNKNDIWFKETIPTSAENTDADGDIEADKDNALKGAVDTVAKLDSSNSAVTGQGMAARAARGFVQKLQMQKGESNKEVHTNRLPSKIEYEAVMHTGLCLDYMEIVDKALVDEVPKIFVMTLVKWTIDFLTGGKHIFSYRTLDECLP